MLCYFLVAGRPLGDSQLFRLADTHRNAADLFHIVPEPSQFLLQGAHFGQQRLALGFRVHGLLGPFLLGLNPVTQRNKPEVVADGLLYLPFDLSQDRPQVGRL